MPATFENRIWDKAESMPPERLRASQLQRLRALIARELLLRKSPLRPGGWLFTLVTSVALAISALYELVEWLAAVLLGQGADAFLGTQGDPWDTQWDMFLALVGAAVSQLVLGRVHDRQLARLGIV